MKKGVLIAFEGIDGTGKTSQIPLLADFVREQEREVVCTKEPSDGPYGTRIRELFHQRETLSPEEELNLFLADRKDHVERVIDPALERGAVVLTDRYYFSTAAYQGAMGMNPEDIFIQNNFAPVPDAVLLLCLSPEESIARIRHSRNEPLNDFEQLEQLRQVAENFASFQHPAIHRISANREIQAIQQDIRTIVEPLL